MADRTLKAENLGELQIWIEGQFALVNQAQETASKDITAVRSRVHDLSNDMAKFAASCSPEKLAMITEHDLEIKKLNDESIARKSSLATIKAAYTIVGAGITTIVGLVLTVAKVIHI